MSTIINDQPINNNETAAPPKGPKGWPEGVWLRVCKDANKRQAFEAPTKEAFDIAVLCGNILTTAQPDMATGILKLQPPAVVEQAHLRAKHADAIAEFMAKLEAAKKQIEIDRAYKEGEKKGKEKAKREATSKMNKKMPESIATAVQELGKFVLNGFNLAEEERSSILNAKSFEDLEKGPAQTKRYAPYIQSAQKDRREADPIYKAAQVHLTKLFAPPTTEFKTVEEERAAFTNYVKGARASAINLAGDLWNYREHLAKGHDHAKDMQRKRLNGKKRGAKKKAATSKRNRDGEEENDLFDKEEEEEEQRLNSKKRAKSEDEDEVVEDEEEEGESD